MSRFNLNTSVFRFELLNWLLIADCNDINGCHGDDLLQPLALMEMSSTSLSSLFISRQKSPFPSKFLVYPVEVRDPREEKFTLCGLLGISSEHSMFCTIAGVHRASDMMPKPDVSSVSSEGGHLQTGRRKTSECQDF
jgi:hypothetical protein